jgi:hypothetical protein
MTAMNRGCRWWYLDEVSMFEAYNLQQSADSCLFHFVVFVLTLGGGIEPGETKGKGGKVVHDVDARMPCVTSK